MEPLAPFYRFSPFPSSPVATPPLPASPRRPPLSPVPPATSSRLCRLSRVPAGRAVATRGVPAASSSPGCPPFSAGSTGGAFPPASSGVAATAPSPAGCCSSPEEGAAPEARTVCVTGGISFVGLAVVDRLLRHGYAVRLALETQVGTWGLH
jgi:hypothetical protein